MIKRAGQIMNISYTASFEDADENHARLRRIHTNVIETIFNTLPTETKARKKEQESRRKFKERIVAKYQEHLIVDSTGHAINGKEEVQYTNTILVTHALKWWKSMVLEKFKEKYVMEQKGLSSGDQVIWRDKNGDKFLTFTFYPSKQKMMVQGNHNDIQTWINYFRQLAEESDATRQIPQAMPETISQVTTTDYIQTDKKDTTEKANMDAPDKLSSATNHKDVEPEMSTSIVISDTRSLSKTKGSATEATGDVDVDITLTEDDTVLFYSPMATQTEVDLVDGNKSIDTEYRPLFPSLPVKNLSMTRKKQARRSSQLFFKSHTSPKDSQRIRQMQNHFDTIDGLLAGLQGGLLQVVDSIQEHKTNTENAVTKLINISEKILEKVSNNNLNISKHNGNVKEVNQVKECVCQLQSTVTKKLSSLTEQVKILETSSEKSTEIQSRAKNDLMQYIREENEKVISIMSHGNRNSGSDQAQCSMDNSIGVKISEKKNETRTSPHDVESAPQRHVNGGRMQSSQQVSGSASDHVHRGSGKLYASNNRYDFADRDVLIIGDSTTKHIDKRRVLRNQTISKCRAATIPEAHSKISAGSSYPKKKIVFCLGVNDVRNCSQVDKIIDEMEDLIRETKRVHTGCKIYICSILPIKCGEILKENIKRTNAQFEHLSTARENVHYVDVLAEFISHSSMHDLFERDGVHPSLKGSMIMQICIRNSLQFDHTPSRQFTSKRANTASMTYAECISRPKGLSENKNMPTYTTRTTEQNPFQHGYFPGNPWWPPEYTSMMPFYPLTVPTAYSRMFAPMRNDSQPVTVK